MDHYAHDFKQGVGFWSGCPINGQFDHSLPTAPQFADAVGSSGSIHAIFVLNTRTYSINATCKSKVVNQTGPLHFGPAQSPLFEWDEPDREVVPDNYKCEKIGYRPIAMQTPSVEKVETRLTVTAADSDPPYVIHVFGVKRFELSG